MIAEFRGKYRWLSNFWFCPVEYEGLLYDSSECAYQAAKTTNKKTRNQMCHMMPGEAKRFARLFGLRRPHWEEIKLPVMLEIVRDKFIRNEALGQMLIATGDQELVEGNYWHDTFWGVYNGVGKNHLGKILMQVRSELRSKKEAVSGDESELS